MMLDYKINAPITAEQVKELFSESGLNRPQELDRIQKMIDHATVLITAWDHDKPVGILRAFTDYTFDCYVNDLAVHKAYQRKGIGQELLHRLRSMLGDETLLFLIAAPDAAEFYRKLGFQNFSRVEDTWHLVNRSKK